jgi:hypothetical protein
MITASPLECLAESFPYKNSARRTIDLFFSHAIDIGMGTI